MLSLIKRAAVGVAFLLLASSFPAFCATLEDAKALVEKAAALIEKDGEKALPVIQDPNGEFQKPDLYVFMADRNGIARVHINPKMVGMNMSELTDPDGVKVVKEQIKVGDTQGSGWTSYKYTNPETKKIQLKKVWVHKVGEFYVACGVYVSE